MTVLAAALPYISAAGTILSTISEFQAGRQANADAKFQAKQLEQQAGQNRAAAQREAIEQKHKAKLAGSRAAALSAAGGGGVDDPTVINILGDIQTQGDYNADAALYTGEERALSYETSASAKRIEGSNARTASYFKVGNTLISGLSGNSLVSKYSPTGGEFDAVGAGASYADNEARRNRGYY